MVIPQVAPAPFNAAGSSSTMGVVAGNPGSAHVTLSRLCKRGYEEERGEV
jgi:hypothetical protein